MKINLEFWRQDGRGDKGHFDTHTIADVDETASFLEMLDQLNEELFAKGERPVAFDSDCREGICGQCGIVINGDPHGPLVTTTCQLHMRSFKDGDTITIEPWRSTAFPVLKDLVVDRSALDRIVQAGGYISINTGAAPDAHAVPVPKITQIAHSKQQLASAVAHVWQPARTVPQCSSPPQRSCTSACFHKASQSAWIVL